LQVTQRTKYQKISKTRKGYFYRVFISGNTEIIPCRIERKKASERKQKKNPLVTGFKIEEIGEDKFYGFELSGDHLYLTSDFMIHHNSGKSLIIANVVKDLGEKTIILQPGREILLQNHSKLLSYGFDASIYSASLGRKEVSNITFATIGSVVNKPDLFKEFKYIISDECHLVNSKGGMYESFINKLNIKVLGLTASPYRLSTDGFGGSILKFLTRTRPRIFSKVIYYIQNKQLFDEGYLAKLKYFEIKGFDSRRLVINSTGADYTDSSVRSYYKIIKFQDNIVRVVNRLLTINRKNVLVFTRFIEEAQYVVDRIPGAAIVTGETPKQERKQILDDYKSGKIKVVCNVGVLTLGFDYPELETVVLARPTMSLALFYQMIGRILRPHKDKEYGMVVDMCENIKLFGHIEDITIHEGKHEKWFITNKERSLTNVYFNRGNANSPNEPKFKPFLR